MGDPDAEIRRIATLESAGPGRPVLRLEPEVPAAAARHARLGRDPRARGSGTRRACRGSCATTPTPTTPGRRSCSSTERAAALRESTRRRVVEPGAEDRRLRPRWGRSAMSRAARRLGERVVLGSGCTIGEGVQIGEDGRPGSRRSRSIRGCADRQARGDPRGRGDRRRRLRHGARSAGAGSRFRRPGASCIGDDVEIGANTTIDRGALDDTVIEDGVKLDNQIQIAPQRARRSAHRDGRLRRRSRAARASAGTARSAARRASSGHIEIADHVIDHGDDLRDEVDHEAPAPIPRVLPANPPGMGEDGCAICAVSSASRSACASWRSAPSEKESRKR